MESIGKDCNELKAKYDECFQVWFSEKFLKGDTNDDMCKPIFNVYRDCVRKAMKENNINLDEVDLEILGTENEKTKSSTDES
jgi:TRIAP1/MDM35 family protein